MLRTSQAPRTISPHDSSTSSSAIDSNRVSRLPTELLSEQAQRLVVFSTVALVLWSFALLLDSFVMPWLWTGWVRNWRAISLQLCGASASAVMYWYLRRASTTLEGIGATPEGKRVQPAWLDLEVSRSRAEEARHIKPQGYRS